jgi:hypothetical protein
VAEPREYDIRHFLAAEQRPNSALSGFADNQFRKMTTFRAEGLLFLHPLRVLQI